MVRPAAAFTMKQVLGYPFPTELVAAPTGERIAWVFDQRGVRNIWVAEGPAFSPRPLTDYTEDDGQELTDLVFTRDGQFLIWVRGGDHDANWPPPGGLEPDPSSSPARATLGVWSAPFAGGPPKLLGEGDEPAPSPRDDRVAFIKDHQVFAAPADGSQPAAQLFFCRGQSGELAWSPDGSALAFVSDRDDHSFIALYESPERPIRYLSPSTSRDSSPVWSADGRQVAFVRRPGRGGAPEPLLGLRPDPWSIWVADASTGAAREVWKSPDTLLGSFPRTAGQANLHWAAGGRLIFLGDLDNWPHLYSIPSAGGAVPLLLTPGRFMDEYVTMTPDARFAVYNANTGKDPADDDRRHLYRVPVDAARPEALTSGSGIEWSPVVTGDGKTVAYVRAGAAAPPLPAVRPFSGGAAHVLAADQIPRDFPSAELVEPRRVVFQADDGIVVHGQLFEKKGGAARKPGVIFVHGGPPRQMLLGWHYMDYYSNSYAVNQYLADHGFIVLSVNYRLGIGYGHAFHHPDNAGRRGAAEYRDVLAGAKFLQRQAGVDPDRIGIWGGSYGGFLTALALARDSDIFKAGVDFHGVHDWAVYLKQAMEENQTRYEKDDAARALEVAWQSSPIAAVGSWRSPVLLIQGDDDRNVHFHQTVDLARRLAAAGVPFEELVIPDEIHGFLRYASWLRADKAAVEYLEKKLGR
jgi:dipeptidyl aminopeptidase/acylaminoacyl peptidase